MILFTKTDCERCAWVKANCDLTNVAVRNLDGNAEAHALLAYDECVGLSEKGGLPILAVAEPQDRMTAVGAETIAAWLGTKPDAEPLTDDCGDACVL
ncbi:MAG: hypothetical protein V1792_25035 [Pseudomonadota bacterium]